jgi:hypothetical protein
MIISKAVAHNRNALIISSLSVAIFWSSSFLPRVWPSFFSRELKFVYFLSIPFLLAAIGIFGLVSLILIFIANRRNKPPGRIWVTGLCLLLSSMVLTPLTFAIHRHIPRALPGGSGLRAFDATLWQAESSTDWNEGISTREQMLKDVVENILPGKNKQEIETLLGASLQTNYFKNLDKDLIYYLGPERDGLFNIDSEWLLS